MASNQLNEAILNVVSGKGDLRDVARTAGCSLDELESETRLRFAQAVESRNSEDLELICLLRGLLNASLVPGTREQQIRTCEILCNQDWHILQEDIMRELQSFAAPSSVVPIQSAISLKPRLAHLTYDDYGSFYKKCLWALAAIGTEEAISAIASYVTSSDNALAEEAVYRLNRIQNQSQKG